MHKMNAISDWQAVTRRPRAEIQLEATNVFAIKFTKATGRQIATILTNVFSIRVMKMLIVSILTGLFIVNVLITSLVMDLHVKTTTNVLMETMTVIQMQIV